MAEFNISNGYEVKPARNGGWVVIHSAIISHNPILLAAFSNHVDLIAWLRDRHEDLLPDQDEVGRDEIVPGPINENDWLQDKPSEIDRLVPRQVPRTEHTDIDTRSQREREDS